MSTQNRLPMLLAVDDEPANLSLIKRIFQSEFKVYSASNGQDALDLLVQATFDVVLLDIMMPGMSGLKVLEIIRSKPTTTDLPVLLVSALSDADDVVRGLQIGANDYVAKPIDADVMVARVKTQLAIKQLQDERKRTITELQAAHEMKDAMFKIATHDLKGPLGNIRMAQYLLRAMLEDRPDVNDILDSVDSTLATMNGVIEEFLGISALQNGAIETHISDVRMEDVITGLVKQYQPNAVKKDIQIQIHNADGMVRADRDRFMQSLSNLVSNALKYSPSHTTVSIWTEGDEDRLRVCVADQGPGIPAEERNRLFTQFGKLSPRPTAGESSTGLGLWSVKHLINLQHGDVGVDCPTDGGSVFWIEMPAVH